MRDPSVVVLRPGARAGGVLEGRAATSADGDEGKRNGEGRLPGGQRGMAFRLPFDAALSPDGRTAYFTALAGDGAALFKSPVQGGAATKLADLVGPGAVT
mgnify:CR=1 FL=1